MALTKSPDATAIAYAFSNWVPCAGMPRTSDLEIDNDPAERSLRGVAVGPRKWTFLGSDIGGRTAAVLPSFIASFQRLKIDPWAYPRAVLSRNAKHPINARDELLPANWKPANA